MNVHRFITLAIVWLLGAVSAPGAMRVVALHPYIGDLARNVGGEYVEVVDLMPVGKSPHTYEPTPENLKDVAEADMILASGKKLELYLNKIRDNMADGAALVEVGRKVPSCTIQADNDVFVCCPVHSVGGIDPHWWNSVTRMQRAVKIVAQEFAERDPERKAIYQANAKAYEEELDQLRKWAKKEISSLPRSKRYLATAHAAFGYFCKDFGFKAVPVQGLTKERNPTPKYLAETIEILRKKKIPAVFPENSANPKVLEAMVTEAGVKLGGKLLADGPSEDHSTYMEAFRYNVETILDALKP